MGTPKQQITSLSLIATPGRKWTFTAKSSSTPIISSTSILNYFVLHHDSSIRNTLLDVVINKNNYLDYLSIYNTSQFKINTLIDENILNKSLLQNSNLSTSLTENITTVCYQNLPTTYTGNFSTLCYTSLSASSTLDNSIVFAGADNFVICDGSLNISSLKYSSLDTPLIKDLSVYSTIGIIDQNIVNIQLYKLSEAALNYTYDTSILTYSTQIGSLVEDISLQKLSTINKNNTLSVSDICTAIMVGVFIENSSQYKFGRTTTNSLVDFSTYIYGNLTKNSIYNVALNVGEVIAGNFVLDAAFESVTVTYVVGEFFEWQLSPRNNIWTLDERESLWILSNSRQWNLTRRK